MSSFFKKIADGAVDLEESMLGPDYKYYKYIRTPGQMGASSAGNMDAMAKDVAGIINYVELLVAGGGRAFANGGITPNVRHFQAGGVPNSGASIASIDRLITARLTTIKVINVATDTQQQAINVENVQNEASI